MKKPKRPPSIFECSRWADAALREIVEEQGMLMPSEKFARREVYADLPRRRRRSDFDHGDQGIIR